MVYGREIRLKNPIDPFYSIDSVKFTFFTSRESEKGINLKIMNDDIPALNFDLLLDRHSTIILDSVSGIVPGDGKRAS